MSAFTHLVALLGRLLEPVLAESATAAAIVLFTVLVRLALYPLSRAGFRGATPVAAISPMLLQLPVFFVMYRAFSAAEIGGSTNELLGRHLFAAPLGDRWGDALGDGGLFGARGLVFLGLFAAIAVVAAWSAVRGRRAAALAADAAEVAAAEAEAGRGKAGGGKGGGGKGGAGKAGAGRAGGGRAGGARARAQAAGGARTGGKAAGVKPAGALSAALGAGGAVSAEQREVMRKLGGVLPLLSFGTLITAALVPLAAGLYLVTTTAWSVAERIWLQHRKDRAEAAGRALSGAERSVM